MIPSFFVQRKNGASAINPGKPYRAASGKINVIVNCSVHVSLSACGRIAL
jgi:hypothetical protein